MGREAKNDYARQLQDLPASIHGYFVSAIAVLGPVRSGGAGEGIGHPNGRPGRGPGRRIRCAGRVSRPLFGPRGRTAV